jgi:hypothetical protein
MSKDFPKMMYRANGAVLENRIFESEDAVEAGWSDRGAAKAALEPEKSLAAKGAVAMGDGAHADTKKLADATKALAESEAKIGALADELSATRQALAASEELNGALEARLDEIDPTWRDALTDSASVGASDDAEPKTDEPKKDEPKPLPKRKAAK